MTWFVLKTLFVILALILIPGWGIISIANYWRKWNTLQRWFLASAVSIAFWTILFYSTRFVFPSLRLGINKIVVILFFFIAIIVINLRKNWKEQFAFGDKAEIIAGILLLTLSTRLIIAYQYPYLVLGDPLHHTILTNIVATTGKLPYTMLPFDSADLNHYHLGLYTMTGPLQMLAGIQPDQALLWFSQFLNGLCGVGVFLFLDRKVSRQAGIIGMVSAGLFSVIPSWLINWGRFTQVAGQTILLPAVLITWEALGSTVDGEKIWSKRIITGLILAGVLNAGVCLIHFQVALFMLPLILIICLLEVIKSVRKRVGTRNLVSRILLIGIITAVIILPTLISGLKAYVDKRTVSATPSTERKLLTDQPYYNIVNDTTVELLKKSSPYLLMGITGILAGFRTRKDRLLSAILLTWILCLISISQLYRLNNNLLAFTNLSTIILTLYLPLSIGAGILWNVLFEESEFHGKGLLYRVAIVSLLIIGVITYHFRLNDFESHRALMTDADREAMEWIKTNTNRDAVFGVNSNFLNPTMPFGTDAGYWLPVYAERQTSALTLLSQLSNDYQFSLERAKTILRFYETGDITPLCEYGIDYLYSGVQDPLGSKDLANQPELLDNENLELVYDQMGVQIFRICER
jgi:hypothetical protein